ncbi:uncharacterized protein LOC122293593 [Carya illinoinensis]|uniref:uncharacterized protein LOC122293593 n=1 Tax=Carya illinoinensis TaxID=32201 RepID=UPI001C71C5EC|nr:uncharacterized protein LOC122293593 [Carya illinoinensis]
MAADPPPSPSSNAASPFFLHPSDNPGVVLVTQLLFGDNYHTWCRSMTMAISAKNKLGFVDGTITKPASTASLFSSWLHCNNMVISWLLNSISPEIAASVLYVTTAFEIWTDLKERFSQKNGPQIFQIQKSISSLSQGQLTVSAYFTRLKALWDDLLNYKPVPMCSCGAVTLLNSYVQQERILQFLMGLNESFASARAQILLMEPLPPLNKVFSLVLQEEPQREIFVPPPLTDAHAFVANSDSLRPVKTFPKKDRPICKHCGCTGDAGQDSDYPAG